MCCAMLQLHLFVVVEGAAGAYATAEPKPRPASSPFAIFRQKKNVVHGDLICYDGERRRVQATRASSDPIIKQQQELYFSKYQRRLTNAQLNDLVEAHRDIATVVFSRYRNTMQVWQCRVLGVHI